MAVLPIVGARVAWSARYLTAICPQTGIGQGHPCTFLIGPQPHARGRIIASDSDAYPLIHVLWDGFVGSQIVNADNLICEGEIDLDARRWDLHEINRRLEIEA